MTGVQTCALPICIKDARSLIEHYKFDLAIIDMQLPDGTGFDVSEILKNNGA